MIYNIGKEAFVVSTLFSCSKISPQEDNLAFVPEQTESSIFISHSLNQVVQILVEAVQQVESRSSKSGAERESGARGKFYIYWYK